MRDTEQHEHAGEGHPRGTLVLMLIFLVIIIGLWGAVYFTLLQRG